MLTGNERSIDLKDMSCCAVAIGYSLSVLECGLVQSCCPTFCLDSGNLRSWSWTWSCDVAAQGVRKKHVLKSLIWKRWLETGLWRYVWETYSCA